MSKKITYVIEVSSAYDGLEDAISKLDLQKKPLYIAKDEDDSGAVLEYIADITKIDSISKNFELHKESEFK
tara:strand:+ start:383 stop:595 length:213 start_codon:yes stop_codon:yes gene_type:complete